MIIIELGKYDKKPHPQSATLSVAHIFLVVQLSIVAVRLVELVESLRLGLTRTADPDRSRQLLDRVGPHRILEDILEGLCPLNTIVQTLEVPEVLQEVQE